MEKFWRAVGVQLGKQWKIVIAVVVVITAVLALGARQIEFATGQDSYLNPDSQTAIDNVEFQDNFGGETVILLFTAKDGADVDVSDLLKGKNLAEFQRLNAALAEIPEVFSVVTPLTSATFSSELVTSQPVTSTVGTNALLAAASRDEAGAEARSADISVSLARRGAAGEQTLENSDWVELLVFDNEGFTAEGGNITSPPAEELKIRKSLASTFPNVEGGPINQTAVGGVILAGNATLDEQSAGTKQVVEVLDSANIQGFDLTVTGSPVYLAEINDYLKGGMLTLGLAALAVMAVILFLIFKVRWRLLPLLAVLVGVAWSFSILGLIGIDLSLVTISGLPILIGLGIDFAIQIHNRVEEEVVIDQDAHPISETVANVAPPLIAATIAGILAFLALRISKVPMIRDFGVLLAVGVVVLVIVGIVVPVSALGMREWSKPTKVRPVSYVEKLVVKLGGLPTKLGLPLIVVSMALFIGGVLAEGGTKIESDPVKWIDQGSQTVADINQLEESTGFGTTLGILVQANNVYDPAVVQMIYEFTVDAEARPEVVTSSSLVNTMAKIISIGGATEIAPTSADVASAGTAAQAVVPDIARALVNADGTATQVNLRLAPSGLTERGVLVKSLSDDLDARIAALDLSADSVLLNELPDDQTAVRATPAGLATVGVGLLENLSANRANLTYLALMLAGIFLVLRFRSAPRALLALVPVLLAVGLSSLFVGLLGFSLSPLTTVSGPLVIASCAEFSVLILGRYLEERQRGLSPREATDTAASRTGRAFFTSAMTTIGGFAVLIGSALPLLRDFGIIVTLNVAIALLAALVVMPPLAVWVDERGWLGTQEQGFDPAASVRMAAKIPGKQTLGAAIAVVALAAGIVAVYATADTSSGESNRVAYAATPLPTTTTTTTTTIAPAPTTTVAGTEPGGPAIDPSTFGTDRPTSVVGGVLFDLLTGPDVGIAPNVANCAIETLQSRVGDDELLALGAATAEPAAVVPITAAALDCGITQNEIDRAIAIQRGEEPPPVADAPAETTPATTEPAGPLVDPSGFGTERPTTLVGGVLFDLLTRDEVALAPNVANCAIETLASRVSDDELLALGAATAEPASVVPITQAAIDCGIDQELIDIAITLQRGG
jgi:hydrophobe/amphiphile efflux-3 (HAE3) family protein